jgi:hypothetical protein
MSSEFAWLSESGQVARLAEAVKVGARTLAEGLAAPPLGQIAWLLRRLRTPARWCISFGRHAGTGQRPHDISRASVARIMTSTASVPCVRRQHNTTSLWLSSVGSPDWDARFIADCVSGPG